MQPVGPDQLGWFMGTEMTVDGDCRGPQYREEEEDMSSDEDDLVFGGSNNSEYVTTNETSPGDDEVGSLSSNPNILNRCVGLASGRHRLDFDGQEIRDQNSTYSDTPRSDLNSIPRSFAQKGEWNIYQQPSSSLPFKDLNEQNLAELHPHLSYREQLPEIEEWVRRGKCSGKAVPTEKSSGNELLMKDWSGEKVLSAISAPNRDMDKLKTQHVPDSSGRSRTEHRQIGEQSKPRQRNTATDEENVSKIWKKM
ncbi:hypothetical protein BKA64DRAFT_174723 [Cadophora sp. MPI-SDFR-AT-0126]|nr:hypothetical protein BKA64DRAFT_174723 [Leotiomycetes sp. MPI-SDFR-AT-0126]